MFSPPSDPFPPKVKTLEMDTSWLKVLWALKKVRMKAISNSFMGFIILGGFKITIFNLCVLWGSLIVPNIMSIIVSDSFFQPRKYIPDSQFFHLVKLLQPLPSFLRAYRHCKRQFLLLQEHPCFGLVPSEPAPCNQV